MAKVKLEYMESELYFRLYERPPICYVNNNSHIWFANNELILIDPIFENIDIIIYVCDNGLVKEYGNYPKYKYVILNGGANGLIRFKNEKEFLKWKLKMS